jgi:predicted chitinase
VTDFQFSNDGRQLLTGTLEGIAALWLWKTEDLRAEACKRLMRICRRPNGSSISAQRRISRRARTCRRLLSDVGVAASCPQALRTRR